MQSTLRFRIIGIILLGIPLAITAIGVSIYQYQEQVDNIDRMNRASELSGTLDKLFAQVLRASNRNRGYLLSSDPEQLKDYQHALTAIPALVATLSLLSEENPEQAENFPKLKATLAAKLAYQATMLDSFQKLGFPGVRNRLISDEGALRLEAFRTAVSALRTTEYQIATRYLSAFRDGLLLQLAVLLSLVLCGGIWTSMLSATAIRGILIPVRAMINHVNRIAANVDVKDLPVLRRDEIGRLAVHINEMTHRVREAQSAREASRLALIEERQNLVDAVEALTEGFAAFDAQELLVQCNQRYCEIYPEIKDIALRGVSLEALLRRRAEFGRETEAWGRIEEWVAEKLADFRNPGVHSDYQMNDGTIIRKSEHHSRNGGTVGVYVDITQLKNTEAALRSLNAELDLRVTERTDDLDSANRQLERLNAELSTLIRSAPVAIMALDTQTKVTIWNPAAERLTGFSEQEARDVMPDLAAPENADAFFGLLKQVSAGENIDNIELELRRRDGSPIIANISAAGLWDARRVLHGAILTLVDLTESRALQEQFQQSQKMEVVAELTAGVAHDFNNLLGIIIANLDMLEQRIPKEGLAPELLAAALRASLSGVALNRQLLAFSRRHALRPVNVNVQEIIEGLRMLLNPVLGEHIDCVIDVKPGVWSAMIDPSLLESAILNLAVNARDAMPQGGRLTIAATNELLAPTPNSELDVPLGECVKITVADTGAGMTPEVIAHAFEPFFTTKGFGKGSGLGLSMVYGFARQSGGNIRIQSVLGKGTAIHIYLPRAAELSVPDRAEVDMTKLEGSGETILVVEDNDALRHAVVLQLRELGYLTIEADCAKPALQILKGKSTVDLMLTDIVMPGGRDGRALAREAVLIRAALPIVFMSGFPATSDGNLLTGWLDEDADVLEKPVRRRELAQSIRHCLSARAAAVVVPPENNDLHS